MLPEQFLALFVTRRSLFASSDLLIGGGFARLLNIGRVADISRINIFLVHHAVKDVFPARRRERLQCPHLYFPKEEVHG